MQPVARPASTTAFPADRCARLHRGAGPAAALLLLLAAGGATAPAEARPASGRVVAIGDIHGAGDQLHEILQRAGLIDAERNWTGGTATLVQTGDFTDRGPQVRAVMDLLMRLEDRAGEDGRRGQGAARQSRNDEPDGRRPGRPRRRSSPPSRRTTRSGGAKTPTGSTRPTRPGGGGTGTAPDTRSRCPATRGCVRTRRVSSSTGRRWRPTDATADGCGTSPSPPWSTIRSSCTAASPRGSKPRVSRR